jgi:hypothetical protein
MYVDSYKPDINLSIGFLTNVNGNVSKSFFDWKNSLKKDPLDGSYRGCRLCMLEIQEISATSHAPAKNKWNSFIKL